MPRRHEMSLRECDENAPRLARRFVRRSLDEWGMSAFSESTELLISEVVTNVVVHPMCPEAEVLLVAAGEVLRVEVRCKDRASATSAADDPIQLGGLGLHIVSVVADRWGIDPVPGGRLVWFELDHAEPAAAVEDRHRHVPSGR
jgi:anti-sigma regulatory factor (Ser/Thr protein kinase)